MSLFKFQRSLSRAYTLFLFALFYFLGIRLLGENRLEPELWITAGIQLLTAFLILFLIHYFRIIRENSLLPLVFYLLFVSIDPCFFLAWKQSLYVLCILACFYFLFQSYEEHCPQKHTLGIGMFLTGGAIFHPSFYFLFLLFVFGLYQFKSLNLKTLSAAFVGGFGVLLSLFCWCLYRNDPALLLTYSPDWRAFTPELFDFNLKDLFAFVFLLILLIFSGINIYLAGISEKIKNHIILSFLFFFTVSLLILILIEFQWKMEWMSFLNLSLTILLSHYFSQKLNKGKTYLLILSVLLFMGSGVWNLF